MSTHRRRRLRRIRKRKQLVVSNFIAVSSARKRKSFEEFVDDFLALDQLRIAKKKNNRP